MSQPPMPPRPTPAPLPPGQATEAGATRTDGLPAEATGPARRLCASADLHERDRGVAFDVRLWGQAVRAFALRIDGRPVAYINRCAHVPVEMDWQEGRFLDDMGEAIVCTVHGAMYAAGDGRCIGGPCGRGRLITVPVSESDGWVHWYPSRDVSPLPAATAEPGSAP